MKWEIDATFNNEQKAPAPMSDEEIAEAVAASPEVAAQLAGPPEPFEDTATDRRLNLAFKVSVFGLLFVPTQFIAPVFALICVPIQLYGLYLLWTLRGAQPPVQAKERWKAWVSLIVNVPLWLIAIFVAGCIAGQFDDPSAPHWQNVRFGSWDDHALLIDLPGEFRHDFHDAQSALGPMKVRQYAAAHGADRLGVTIESLPNELRPADASAALRMLADEQFARPGYKVESVAEAKLSGYPTVDMIVRYTDALTRLPRFIQQKIALVDRHVVLLTADVPDAREESRIAKRFFGSAKIE